MTLDILLKTGQLKSNERSRHLHRSRHRAQERLLPGPVERLWAYLTNCLSSDKAIPDKYKGVEHASFEGTITRLEQLRVLAYTWNMGGQDSEVTFELSRAARTSS